MSTAKSIIDSCCPDWVEIDKITMEEENNEQRDLKSYFGNQDKVFHCKNVLSIVNICYIFEWHKYFSVCALFLRRIPAWVAAVIMWDRWGGS